MKSVKKFFIAISLFGLAISGCSRGKQSSSTNSDVRYAIYQLAVADGYEGTYQEWLASIKGEKGDTGAQGEPGKDGQDGHTPVITIGSDGYWYIDGDNTHVKAQGEKGDTGAQGPKGDAGSQGPKGDTGEAGPQGPAGQNGINGKDGTNGKDGADGLTPYIGANGHWWIGTTDTGIAAQGPAGQDGTNGKDGRDGADGKNGADGKDGQDGLTPYIGSNGNWWIGDVDTGVAAQGPQGETGQQGPAGQNGLNGHDGQDGLTPYIGSNGNWWIGTTDTGIAAQGPAGQDGTNGKDGRDGADGQNGTDGANGINGKDGVNGQDGLTPYIGSNGHWWIGDTDTGVAAQGPQGDTGPQGSTGQTAWSCTILPSENGYVTVNKGSAVLGEVIVFTAFPNDGFYISSFIANGLDVTDQLSNNSYITNMVENGFVIRATFNHQHRLQNNSCSICGKSVADICENNLGLTYLSKYENGNNLVGFYNDVNSALKSAYNNLSAELTDFSFSYDSYGLSSAQALNLCDRINCEHPLYYFLSGVYSLNGDTIILHVSDEYKSSSRRQEIQNEICIYLNKFNYQNEFDVLLKAHDDIIDSIDYEYDDNREPSKEPHAHNVVGVVEKVGAVCEGYAKTFQLVCDYCNIPSLIATGTSFNQDHAWNVVQIGGDWYWVDVTWDDAPTTGNIFFSGAYDGWVGPVENNLFWDLSSPNETAFSDYYSYFLVSDDVLFQDHSLNNSVFALDEFLMYELANRADCSYTSNHRTKLNSYFELDGISYQIVRYNQVSVSNVNVNGEAHIPESVSFNGTDYSVVSIGTYVKDDPNLWGRSKIVINEKVTKLFIPKSVRYIYEQSLSSDCGASGIVENGDWYQNNAKEFVVDEESAYFCSVDGVLYTKKMSVLVAYPFGSEQTEFSIPDQVLVTDFGALNGTCPLSVINVGKNYYARYSSYLQCMAIVAGANGGKITIDAENPYYYEEGGLVYSTYDVLGGFHSTGYDNPSSIIALADINRETYTIVESYEKNDRTYRVCSLFVYGFRGFGENGLINIFGSIFDDSKSLKNIICNNDLFLFDGYCLYYDNNMVFGRKDLEHIVFSNTQTIIYENDFYFYLNLKSLTIPTSVTRIEDYALCGCRNLNSINYEGTVEQWNEIDIRQYWDYETGDFTIHCTDGEITKADYDSRF